MSSQRGNVARSRPQKYKNARAFKNNLHDKSNKTKLINNIQVSDVCVRCKDIIEWKIKYKKYKPLTQPKKCIKCDQKAVTKAYHVICSPCGRKLEVCTKCCQVKEVITAPDENKMLKMDNEMKALLQSLPERKRRTFLRYLSKKQEEPQEASRQEQMDDLRTKLNSLNVEDDGSDLFSESDEEDEDSESDNQNVSSSEDK